MIEWFQYSKEVSEINKCKEKIAEERKKIADSEFNIELYTNHLVSKIMTIIPILSENTLRVVWQGINKINDIESEKYKTYYKYINDVIKENIIGDTVCNYKKTKLITEVIACGYSSYAYSIHFIVNGTEFVFTVPVPTHINSENYGYANEGMYCLSYKENQYCYTTITCSYNLEDLHKAFKDLVENEVRKQQGKFYVNTGSIGK